MDRVSLVDLGSNSARLVVFEYERDGGFRLVDEIREVVRLGEGIAASSRLGDDAIQRALVALRAFGDYVDATSLPAVRIMATSAVRSAANRAEFLDAVRHAKLDIEVLEGEAEAALGVLAVANTSRFSDAWVVDLGGGSLQLSRMAARAYTGGHAYPLGAMRVTEALLDEGPATAAQVAAVDAAVDQHIGDMLDRIGATGVPMVAMGGTIRNLARAIQRQRGYPLRLLHAYSLRVDDLEELTGRLIALPARKRGRLSGINGYRGDIILAGALVYRRMMRRAGLDEITISGFGVREGALFEELMAPPHLHASVRRSSVDNLLWQYPQPADHTARVRLLSLQMFDALEPLHGLGDAEAELLDAAACLHDIGKSIHFRDHAKHGAYLLAGTPLPGYNHRDQAMLSLLVRYHRSGKPRIGAFDGILGKRDAKVLRVLTVCLRFAEYLERSRTGRIKGLRATIEPESITLELLADGEPWVEVWETQKQAWLAEAAFKRRLVLTVAPFVPTGC